jgi:hypothetical protein
MTNSAAMTLAALVKGGHPRFTDVDVFMTGPYMCVTMQRVAHRGTTEYYIMASGDCLVRLERARISHGGRTLMQWDLFLSRATEPPDWARSLHRIALHEVSRMDPSQVRTALSSPWTGHAAQARHLWRRSCATIGHIVGSLRRW